MKSLQKLTNFLKSLNAIDWLSIAFLIYIFVFCVIRMFSYSEDLGGAEYSFLYAVQLIEKNSNIYRNPDAFPFYVSMYPPLFSYILYAILKIFHLNLYTDIYQSLLVGRFISLGLWLVDLYLLKKILTSVFSSTRHLFSAFLIFSLLLTIHFFTFRPDSFKLTCFMLFLYFALKFDFSEASKLNNYLAILLAVIAVFFKHDIAAYIVIFFTVRFVMYKSKDAVIHAIIFILLISTGFWICTQIFGAYFIRNIFNYNIQFPSDIKLNLMFISLSILKTFPLIVITILNLKSTDKKVKFIAVLGVLYFMISNLTLFRVGADLNYTYESAILIVINYSIYFSSIKKHRPVLSLFILFYLLLFNKYLFDTTHISTYNQAKEKNLYHEKVNNSADIRKIIGNDVVFFSLGRYMIFNAQSNLIYGYDLHMERSMELTYRYPLKTIMYSNKSVQDYDALYTNGFVKYIVTENDDVAHKQMKKYYKNYYFYKQAGNLLLYKHESI